jgi:hypothetical protein
MLAYSTIRADGTSRLLFEPLEFLGTTWVRHRGWDVHYRWHPLYGHIARVSRGVPRGDDELLFCALPDGTRGALPSWMTDAAACAALTVGQPVVGIAALQEDHDPGFDRSS